MNRVGNVLIIDDLKELSSFLSGVVNESTIAEGALYYIDGENPCFLYDENVPTYHKVPEIASARFLHNCKLLMAKKNHYIPIIDKDTDELLFSEEEFMNIRSKMAGLKRYGMDEFAFSDHLDFPGIDEFVEAIDSNNVSVAKERECIFQYISGLLSSQDITLGDHMGEGDAELIDTGSTARGTNLPEASAKIDFDFILRDEEPELGRIRRLLIDNLHTQNPYNNQIGNTRIRLKDVIIPGLSKPVDIDISFIPTKKIYYSTEEAVSDRLDTIRSQDPEGYKKVIANIMYAKKMLKAAGVYKPGRSDKRQAGLGGIGIENWILQNGGSLIDAAREFLHHAEGKSFLEFESEYPIYDFGKNHVSVARNIFPHDNFVMKNMREIGYYKMQRCLMAFLQEMDYTREQGIKQL